MRQPHLLINLRPGGVSGRVTFPYFVQRRVTDPKAPQKYYSEGYIVRVVGPIGFCR